MVNHHGLEIIHHSGENSCEVRSRRWLLSLSASLLLSARLGSVQITRTLQMQAQTYKAQPFLLIVPSSDTLATDMVKVAAKRAAAQRGCRRSEEGHDVWCCMRTLYACSLRGVCGA